MGDIQRELAELRDGLRRLTEVMRHLTDASRRLAGLPDRINPSWSSDETATIGSKTYTRQEFPDGSAIVEVRDAKRDRTGLDPKYLGVHKDRVDAARERYKPLDGMPPADMVRFAPAGNGPHGLSVEDALPLERTSE